MSRDIEKRAAGFLAELDELFQQRPVYPILLDEDVPQFFVPCGKVAGWTSPWCDLLARRLLEHQGRWQGRGFAFFLDPPPAGDWTDPNWLGMACHEAGHYLTFSDDVCMLDYDNELECIRRALAPQATPEGFERQMRRDGWIQATADPVSRRHHSTDWIRATLHLTHRADFRANPSVAAATNGYGYPHGWRFDLALEFEARQRRNEPIRKILTSSPPRRFTRLANEPTDV